MSVLEFGMYGEFGGGPHRRSPKDPIYQNGRDKGRAKRNRRQRPVFPISPISKHTDLTKKPNTNDKNSDRI